MFNYLCDNVRCIDADTLEVDIDLGFGVWKRKEKLRLYGINAYEKKTVRGQEAMKFVTNLFTHADILEIVLDSRKDKDMFDKFGRYLAIVTINYKNGSSVMVNKLLLDKGFAVLYLIDTDEAMKLFS